MLVLVTTYLPYSYFTYTIIRVVCMIVLVCSRNNDYLATAGQGLRQEPVRAADVGDAGPSPQPHAGAQGQQESCATGADASCYC